MSTLSRITSPNDETDFFQKETDAVLAMARTVLARLQRSNANPAPAATNAETDRQLAELEAQIGMTHGGALDEATQLRNQMKNLINIIRALDSYKTPEVAARQAQLLAQAKRLGARLQALKDSTQPQEQKRGAKRKRSTRRKRTRSTRRKRAQLSS
jgi:hypothetical protein